MITRLGLLSAFLLACAGPALAQVRPIPGTADPRIQTAVWNAGEIVRLRVSASRPLLIEFGEGERVLAVMLGSTRDWQVNVSRDGASLALRSVGPSLPTTMIVRMERRTHTFDVEAGEQMAASVLRFVYPEELAGLNVAPLDSGVEPANASGLPPPDAVQRYRLKGEKTLQPDWIGDDGHKTFIYWGEDKAIPAVLALDDAGRELTIDGFMRGDYYTIDRVWPQLVFRIDKHVASAVRNRGEGAKKKPKGRAQQAEQATELDPAVQPMQVSDGQ